MGHKLDNYFHLFQKHKFSQFSGCGHLLLHAAAAAVEGLVVVRRVNSTRSLCY